MGLTKGGGGDAYFFLWNLTDNGVRDAQALATALRKASAMVRDLGGECHLYISTGGLYDMIGVAQKLDDAKAVQVRHAVDALGYVRTTLVKTREFSLADYDVYAAEVNRLGRLTPSA